ncbi:MAG: hypothetical protein QF475_00720 [Candidatus Undinarchaeales archaeon]|jgi:hypothetical protein|nr:hypothetical protein [Candidatus Undinarchaeales archaeon]
MRSEERGFKINEEKYETYFKNLAEIFKNFLLPLVGEKLEVKKVETSIKGMSNSLGLIKKEEKQSAS